MFHNIISKSTTINIFTIRVQFVSRIKLFLNSVDLLAINVYLNESRRNYWPKLFIDNIEINTALFNDLV